VTGPLNGRVALVTGASRRAGIGYAVARRLGALGAQVVAHGWTEHDRGQPWGVDPSGPDGVLAGIRELAPDASYVEADLGEAHAPERLVRDVHDRHGRLDVLVANHARSGEGGLESVDAEVLDAFWRDNVRSVLLLCRAFAERWPDGPGGRIVILTSGQHHSAMPSELAYAVSKGALQAATSTLAAAVITRGITVNCVNPGPTNTGWAGPEVHEAVRRAAPTGRWSRPDDAASVIGWLCTDDAGWITGQTIDSDGGFSLA
jgi:3-oxoacyl-[acyl-carrier protein] reductase